MPQFRPCAAWQAKVLEPCVRSGTAHKERAAAQRITPILSRASLTGGDRSLVVLSLATSGWRVTQGVGA